MLGVCVDTCHVFAAGYELGHSGYEATVDALRVWSASIRYGFFTSMIRKESWAAGWTAMNISAKGAIGLAGFKNLLNDKRFAGSANDPRDSQKVKPG